ncbi:hypothetical protein BKA80DRAFT_303639 [Phyllosticta citrichinensis]
MPRADAAAAAAVSLMRRAFPPALRCPLSFSRSSGPANGFGCGWLVGRFAVVLTSQRHPLRKAGEGEKENKRDIRTFAEEGTGAGRGRRGQVQVQEQEQQRRPRGGRVVVVVAGKEKGRREKKGAARGGSGDRVQGETTRGEEGSIELAGCVDIYPDGVEVFVSSLFSPARQPGSSP